jgi:hypothetical protein
MANKVTLDALIPREDFAVQSDPAPGVPQDRIGVNHLKDPFFGNLLRKPDFQRETNHWTPTKVADLVRSFLDLDLIPAIILWKSGHYYFVIDGPHRLSALMAWIHDDYGDRKQSADFFGGNVSDEQKRVAEQTRRLVNKTVGGSYAEYAAHASNPATAPEKLRGRIGNLGVNSLVAQWVPATDAGTAENSFFKINQAATPIDPTERRILKARKSASAISARAITHAGTGHKYWSTFDDAVGEKIEELGARIYGALYEPPLGGKPLTTLDVPVAGKGYNALPFVFDLVNYTNGVNIADTTAKAAATNDQLPSDPDGQETLSYLNKVYKRVCRITTDVPVSLGLHPVVYFYTKSGNFQPTFFLATCLFVEALALKRRLDEFTGIRCEFEEYVIQNKEHLSLITHKFGSGARSLPWLVRYLEIVLEAMLEGTSSEDLLRAFASDPNFAIVALPKAGAEPSAAAGKPFSSGTKTAAFFASALKVGTRCAICDALVHKNSMQFDHIHRASDGGHSRADNAQVAHPYCNSTFKENQVRHLRSTGQDSRD